MNCHSGTFTGDKLEEKLAQDAEKELRPICTAFFWKAIGAHMEASSLELHREGWA